MNRLEKEEWYVYFDSCIVDLNNAWIILKRIKKRRNNSLNYTAFKLALIEYSKPYLNSEGVLRKYKLDASFIPNQHLDLHKRILEARNKILAHSDLTIRELELYVFQHGTHKFPVIGGNVIRGTEEFVNINEIIALIEKTLTRMYQERDILKGDLEVNAK